MKNHKQQALKALSIMKNVNRLLDEVTAKHMLAHDVKNKKAA